jgi:myo-inositol-1(or 4)-monophosphatase
VSIACEGLAAAVYDPTRDELFTATAEGPAECNGIVLQPSPPQDLAHALVATGFGYDARRRELQAAVAARVIPRARDVRRGGSAALDLAWTAAGRLDAYYERGVNLWDVAGGELLCARAGLHVERLEPVGELPWGAFAAAPGIAADLRALVA